MNPPAVQPSFRYWAFISYSHADKSWGDWLHRALETYRVPRRLVGTSLPDGESVPARVFPVFRDREELPVSADLPDNINRALEQSRFLVVICSPRAATSRWVNEEIKTFKRLGREDRVLALIVAGEPNASEEGGKPGFRAEDECFPPALRFCWGADGELSAKRAEPIAADARKHGDGQQNAKLKLLAGLLRVNYDDLKQREQERRIRRLRVVVVASLALAGVLCGLTVYSLVQRQRAENALVQGDKLVEFMLNELEVGRLDLGGNQELLKSISERVEAYYTALPAETRKSKGDLQRRLNALLKAKSSLFQGKSEEALRTIQAALPRATPTATPIGQVDPTERYLQFGNGLTALAALSLAGQEDDQALRTDVDALRKTPAKSGVRFPTHCELAMKATLLSLRLSGEEAENLAREAVGICEGLPADWDEDVRAIISSGATGAPPANLGATVIQNSRFFLCMACGALGQAERESDKLDEALWAFRRGAQIANELSDSPMMKSFARAFAADAQSDVGLILQRQHKPEEAMGNFQASLTLFEQLVAADASNVIWKKQAADVRQNIAGLLDEAGKSEEALLNYRAVLEARRQLRAVNLQTPTFQDAEANAYNNVGKILFRLGQGHDREAGENFTEAVAGQHRLLEKTPEDGDARETLAIYQQNLAGALNRQRAWKEAQTALREAVKVWRGRLEKDPGNSLALESMVESLDGLAEALQGSARDQKKEGRLQEYQSQLREALVALDEAATRAAPQAARLMRRADVQTELKDPVNALKDYEAAIALDPSQRAFRSRFGWALINADHPTESLAQFEALAKLAPASEKNADLQAGLAVSNWALGQPLEAVAAYHRLIEISADYAREEFLATLNWSSKETALLQAVRAAAVPAEGSPAPKSN